MTIGEFHAGLTRMLEDGWNPRTPVMMLNEASDEFEELEVDECCDGSFVLDFAPELHRSRLRGMATRPELWRRH